MWRGGAWQGCGVALGAVLLAACALPGGALAEQAAQGDLLAAAHRSLEANRPDEAEASLHRLLAAEPSNAPAHLLLGYALFREIQTREAAGEPMRAFREANARASLGEFTAGARGQMPSAFDLKIVALDYVLLGDYADADKWMTHSLEWNKDDAQAWYDEGRIRFKLALYPAAISAFEAALRLEPRNAKAEDNLGLVLESMGRSADAEKAYRQAIDWGASAPADADAQINLGNLLTGHGRPAEALPYLEDAAKRSPHEARAHEKLAAALAALERWTEARSELEQAATLEPEAASVHFLLASAYRHTGEADKAREELRKTAELKAREAQADRVGQQP